jgi:hypothetical protein
MAGQAVNSPIDKRAMIIRWFMAMLVKHESHYDPSISVIEVSRGSRADLFGFDLDIVA